VAGDDVHLHDPQTLEHMVIEGTLGLTRRLKIVGVPLESL
jgi:hypothetical protein